MYWIAITLGFFGSLHCVGMCGPLALAVLSAKGERGKYAFWSSLSYNTGRTIGYVTLGILFGLIGSAISLSGTQRLVSVGLGIVLVIFALFSINPDHLISRIPSIRNIYTKVTLELNNLLHRSKTIPTIYLGIVNGFLPCGLVYIAIAGAISLSNIWGSMGFMFFFGIGTFPAMIAISAGHHAISSSARLSLKKLYPWISFFMGTYLIYRGFMSKMPLELNFFEALHHPIMCH